MGERISLAVRYDRTCAELNELKAAHEKQAQSLKSSEEHVKMYQKMNEEKERQIEELHQLLDGLPGALPRQSENEEAWKRATYSLVVRFASFLGQKK